MTETRRPNHPGATHPATWIALLLIGSLLQACSPNAGTKGSRLRVYAADLAGRAKTCEAQALTPAPGQTTEVAIKLVNDGGWCGLPTHDSDSKPFNAGLLTVRPGHGSVLIHGVGDETRVDYTPDRGFSGTDSFTVKLIPGNEVVHVSVAVAAPAN